MNLTRRDFLRTAAATAAVLSLPLTSQPVAAECSPDDPACKVQRPAADPSFEPWWVATHLPTKLWPSATEVAAPVDTVEPGKIFRVEEPQQGYRLHVWDPRENRQVFIGSEAVGPADTPFWAAFADDGRWLDVTLTPLQHIKAMQGDEQVMQDLVTAGLQGTTRPGFYRILRRVYNETMDSRTVPGVNDHYFLKDVLYTQYFTGDGAAIHYNWWGPPRGFGYPGSHGCLGMRLDGSKFLWDWAGIGTPVVIHL
ncbi:MAG: L,D-transpeptidase family protein [Chloroflexi bacterium]|nr:L,D-transpeptidase family protein [Chloroflexota bacterium]